MQHSRKSYLVRLIRGDIPLVKTFWLFGFFGFFFFNLLGGILILHMKTIIDAGHNYAFALYAVVYLCYALVIWVAIWNSASKYRRPTWGTIAKLMVILGIISAITDLYFNRRVVTIRQIIQNNMLLPAMVEPGLELKSITFDDYAFYYNYRFVETNFADYNMHELKANFKHGLLEEVCTEEQYRNELELKDLHFIYTDQDNKHSIEVTITKHDCHKI